MGEPWREGRLGEAREGIGQRGVDKTTGPPKNGRFMNVTNWNVNAKLDVKHQK